MYGNPRLNTLADASGKAITATRAARAVDSACAGTQLTPEQRDELRAAADLLDTILCAIGASNEDREVEMLWTYGFASMRNLRQIVRPAALSEDALRAAATALKEIAAHPDHALALTEELGAAKAVCSNLARASLDVFNSMQ